MSAVIEYDYQVSSGLDHSPDGAAMHLATSGGSRRDGVAERHPHFFSGFVERPDVVAAALLVVARVARTRFYVPPNMLAALLRAADPVVTSTAEGLRFESFSACCGVYARLDVLAESLDASFSAAGVTNVDVNPPLRQALAALRPREPLHLAVGDDELRVSTLDEQIVEDKVALPDRWVKGFAETQSLASGMVLVHDLDAAATSQFLRSLPRSSATNTVMWATPALRSLRLASRPTSGAVCLAGPERLRVLEPMLRFATRLRAFGVPAGSTSTPAASTWVLDLPGARLTISLSPEKSRGFSGEGGMLLSLVGDQVVADAELLAGQLLFEPRIDIPSLASGSALTPQRVTDALGVLASSGQVGFDSAEGAYFHRPLPLSAETLSAIHPRLAGAEKLVAHGGVSSHLSAAGEPVFHVLSGGVLYVVALRTGEPDRCTCPWFAKYRGTRGPCKHVLAARISARTVAASGS